MKYAVIYYSETGNTKKLAESLYSSLESLDKVLVDLYDAIQIPKADIYFVGIPVYRQNCRIKVIECLEQIENVNIALFVTCGLNPTEKYKKKIEDALSVWINESCNYLGMHMCQCKTLDSQKEKFYNSNPKYIEQLQDMFQKTEDHPNDIDMNQIKDFAKQIVSKLSE